MGRQRRVMVASISGAIFALFGCAAEADPPFVPPPRAQSAIAFPAQPSHVAIALAVELADLERALERELPRRLWQIHEDDVTCIASKKIDLELFRVKSPKIKCDIDGTVTRGRVRVSGAGRELLVTLPVRARVRAHDVAGFLKGETGTAAAEVRLALRLDLSPEWQLGGKARLDYRWSRKPGIDFLGRRITFTSKADRELAPVRAQIERTLAAELRQVPVRAAAERGWRAAHTVLELNHANPPVWARITPRVFRYGGYAVRGREVIFAMGLDADIATKVGAPPAAAAAGPLPALAPLEERAGRATMHVPVVADYAALEPVIARALARRAERPFKLGTLGTATASFGKIEAYATDNQRIAVGVPFSATSDLAVVPKASGTIWLTARPVNAPNSRTIAFADVRITGDTTLVSEKLLFALANSPDFQGTIAAALQQNFENDFAKLRAKIDLAIARRKDGPVTYEVGIERIDTGVLRAFGEGLYLPVDLTARIAAEPVRLR